MLEERKKGGNENHEETHGQEDDSLRLVPHVLSLCVSVLVLDELDGLQYQVRTAEEKQEKADDWDQFVFQNPENS